jgi:hypothetical protein
VFGRLGIIDAATCVVADRIRVEGNLELDDGVRTDGTFRLPNAVVGGYLRLSGARLAGPYGASEHGIALLADGMEVGGDLEGRDHGRGAFSCAGQIRLVGARVGTGGSRLSAGSVDGAAATAPGSAARSIRAPENTRSPSIRARDSSTRPVAVKVRSGIAR